MNILPKHRFQPLLKTIAQIQLHVQRPGLSHFITTTSTYDSMLSSKLPPHIILTERVVGPRIATRSSHHINYRQAITAIYPQDGMDEVVYAAFAIVVEGTADMRIGDYILSSRTGDILFLPPGIPKPNSALPHLEGDRSGRSCALFWISPSLHLDGIRIFVCRSKESLHLRTQPEEECILKGILFKTLFEECAEEMEVHGPTPLFRQLMQTLLSLAQHAIERDKAISSFGFHQPFETLAGKTHPIDFACDYIEANLHNPLTLTEVARHCYLSPSAFTRRFRQHCGQSFLEYLSEQRMLRARQMLLETDWNVSLICRSVGLKESRFRELFTSRFGQSPMNFRKERLL